MLLLIILCLNKCWSKNDYNIYFIMQKIALDQNITLSSMFINIFNLINNIHIFMYTTDLFRN